MVAAFLHWRNSAALLPHRDNKTPTHNMKYISPVISQGSGSLGGATFSRNKGGSYMRAKVTPTNPQTARQTAVRSDLAGLSAEWRTLTEAERGAWNASTGSWPVQDALGQTKQLSGHQLFNRLNGGRRIVDPGAALLTSPPLPVSVPSVTVTGFLAYLDAGALTAEGDFSPVNVPTDFAAAIYATPCISAGISSPANSAYKLIGVIEASNPFSGWAALFQTFFGAPVIGQKIFLSIDLVSTVSGQIQEVLNTSAIVQPI